MTPDEGLEFLGIVVSEDGETRGINFVEALSKIEEARAEHEKDQVGSTFNLARPEYYLIALYVASITT